MTYEFAWQASEEQRAADLIPCRVCGGDVLRTDFTKYDRCHVPWA